MSHPVNAFGRRLELELAPRSGSMRHIVAGLGLFGHLATGITFLIIAGCFWFAPIDDVLGEGSPRS